MNNWLKKFFYKSRAKEVANYYDKWSQKFAVVSDTFQGFRTKNISDYHQYTIMQAKLEGADKVLDAGCGVGGPAFYFAARLTAQIHALTISKVQVDMMQERKVAEDVENIFPKHGDYHDIVDIYGKGVFCNIVFLESFGHSYHPSKVIHQSYEALKPGGVLYIRDHFKAIPQSEEQKMEMAKLVEESNQLYVYNTPDLDTTKKYIEEAGFKIEMVQTPQVEFHFINEEVEKLFGIRSPQGYFIDIFELRAVKPL